MDNSSPMTTFFRNKWVRLFLIVDAIAIIAVVVFAVNNALKTSVLNFNVTPLDAKIMVNGREYENGAYRVMPGKYDVVVSREGMTTKEFTAELGWEEIANMTVYLVGEGEIDATLSGVNDPRFEFYKLKDNYGSYTKLAEMATPGNNVTYDQDVSAEEFVMGVEGAMGLMRELPIIWASSHYYPDTGAKHTDRITIMNGAEDDECRTMLCLVAIWFDDGLLEDYHKQVDDMILDVGYELGDYEVIYRGTDV